MSAVCPSCGRPQQFGLLCADDTAMVETTLAAVPQLVEQLEVAISRQAKIGGGKAGKGTARERSPINWNAVDARDQLVVAAEFVGQDIDWLRSHPQAAEMVRDLGTAVKNAYRAIDRMQERQYLGICYYEEDGATCHAEIWARPGAREVTCTQCEITHDVAERRVWLLRQAADMLCTVKEASRYVGEVGGIKVTEASIRGYLHRQRLAYRSGTMIRLGDLLTVVVDESERKTA